jgi:D-alanine-D-alanine ligase
LRIAVLMGGDSPEREVSLASGRAIVAALRRRGHEVEEAVVGKVADVAELPLLRRVDVVFPAMHGGQGEDGHLQAWLELMEIPYALSGPLASALAMNKAAAKRVMRGAGIPTPAWLLVTWDRVTGRPRAFSGHNAPLPARGERACTIEYVLERVAAELGFPLVIKPNQGGSSVDVRIVSQPGDFTTVFEDVASRERDILLESYVPGRELTAAILLSRRLPLVEIRPHEGFYDYQNKYTSGASEYVVPAPVHSPLYEQISEDALRLFDLIECRGMARVDFRLDHDAYYCLEINTIPGMTTTSLVPMAAEAVGIGFDALADDLCRNAMASQGATDPQTAQTTDSARRSG